MLRANRPAGETGRTRLCRLQDEPCDRAAHVQAPGGVPHASRPREGDPPVARSAAGTRPLDVRVTSNQVCLPPPTFMAVSPPPPPAVRRGGAQPLRRGRLGVFVDLADRV